MSVGHPDWAGYAQWRGAAVVDSEVVYPAGDTAGAIQTTAHWASLMVHAHLVAGQASVEIVQFNNPAGGGFAQSYTWEVTTSTGLIVSVPLNRTYWRYHVVVPAAQTGDLQLFIAPTNVGQQNIAYPVVGNSVLTGSVNYAAGTSADYPVPHVQGGAAYVFFDPDDGSGKLVLDLYEQTASGGSGNRFYHLDTITAFHSEVIYLPDIPVLARVTNTDGAAAHSGALALVAGGPT